MTRNAFISYLTEINRYYNVYTIDVRRSPT